MYVTLDHLYIFTTMDDDSPFRQTFELGIFISTGGKSRGVASPKLVGGGPKAQHPDILCIER